MSQAIIVLEQRYGTDYGEGALVAKSSFNFLSVDDATLSPTTAPLRIPQTGTQYSYETWLRFRCEYAPLTKVFNFRVWTDGELNTGLNITANNTEVASYREPVDVVSDQGTRIDLVDYASQIVSILVTGELSSVGDKTSYLVLQEEVTTDANPVEESESIYYSYDEI